MTQIYFGYGYTLIVPSRPDNLPTLVRHRNTNYPKVLADSFIAFTPDGFPVPSVKRKTMKEQLQEDTLEIMFQGRTPCNTPR